ncbi:MAG: 3'(2'),5'-bisphosphate nucleotidase CysQ [Lentisphaeria bacterium]|nr:3'(2'),5'-bisphosphate nucleotidase CysQ [Candidatus Neomarinimicrobiota bacterium]MCF7842972.1 3'(2'),5'-bisphosphate nucleotidase CysQ [Lentisphaeria bacterium]
MKELVQIAQTAATRAGSILLEYYKDEYEIRDKSYHNPVTTADHAADDFLKEFILKETPDFGWLSEETVDSPDRLEKEYVWIVDPLDGTKEFIEGVSHFVVSVGLVKNGEPVLGVIYNPVRKELIYTNHTGQALLNDEETHLCQAKELTDVGCVNSRSETRRGLWEPWQSTFRKLVPIGSVAYKLALVGTGREDFFVTLRPKNEWDICAGHAILKANGGILKVLDGTTVQYNKPTTISKPGLVGGNPVLVEKFLEAYKNHSNGSDNGE